MNFFDMNEFEDGEALLRESLFGSSATFECYCEDCGEYAVDAEPDADFIGGEDGATECHYCGPGTRIASPLRLWGLM